MAAHAATRVRTRPSWLRWRKPAALQASAQPQEPSPAPDRAAPPAVRWADSPFAGRSVEIAHEPAGAPVSLDGPPGMARPFAPPSLDEPVLPPLAWLRVFSAAGQQDYQLHGLPAPGRVAWAGVEPVGEVNLGDAAVLRPLFAGDEESLRALAAVALAQADAVAAEKAARQDPAPARVPGGDAATAGLALLGHCHLEADSTPEPLRSRIRAARYSLQMAVDLYYDVLDGVLPPGSPLVVALGATRDEILARVAEDITVATKAVLTAIDGRGPDETVPDDGPDDEPGTREDPAAEAPAETGHETVAPAGDDAPAAPEAAAGEPELAGGAL